MTATSSTLDQIFEIDLARVFDDLGAALVAEVLLDFLQLLDDDGAQHLFRTQNLQVLGDHALDLGQFVEDLLLLHAGEALELQFDDGLRLAFAEVEHARIDVDQLGVAALRPSAAGVDLGIAHQGLARFLRILRRADQLDHHVEIVRAPSGSRAGYARARAPCATGKSVRRRTTSMR